MNVQLPIRFQTELIPALWRMFHGLAEKWRLTRNGLGLSFSVPEWGQGAFVTIPLEDLNSTWRERLSEEKRRVLRMKYVAALDEGRGEEIELLSCIPTGHNVIAVHDPRTLRGEFFELRERTDDLLNFLERNGMWSLRSDPHGEAWRSGISKQGIVPSGAIWRDRVRFKERMRSGSDSLSSWFTTSRNRMLLEPIDRFPFYACTARSIRDAIEASIGFDLLQGSRFKLCARADCKKPFEITRKARKYCSYDCAHLEAVRRSRRPGTRRKEK